MAKKSRDYSPQDVIMSDTLRAIMNNSPEEPNKQSPETIEFRGNKYPINYEIKSRWKQGEIPAGTIIGHVTKNGQTFNLVWDGKKIIVLSRKNWRNEPKVR